MPLRLRSLTALTAAVSLPVSLLVTLAAPPAGAATPAVVVTPAQAKAIVLATSR